jgi:D-sedoheptulose 7-phosphate isomerase
MSDNGNQIQRVRDAIAASISVKQLLLDNDKVLRAIAAVTSLVTSAFTQGNEPILFGSGGSAADAQHIAAEFVGRFAVNRPALPAIGLSVNTSRVTGIGNDYGFEQVFALQIEALGHEGDVAMGISTGGSSPNVVNGIQAAKLKGLQTVATTGANGGLLKTAEIIVFVPPSNETPEFRNVTFW